MSPTTLLLALLGSVHGCTGTGGVGGVPRVGGGTGPGRVGMTLYYTARLQAPGPGS